MRSWSISFALLVLALACAPAARADTGYDVFRPWSTTPAACPGSCSGAVSGGAPENLKTFYDALAAAHPATVERVVYGHSGGGQELVAYRVGSGADGSKPVTLYAAAQHGGDSIAAELQRRLFAYVVAHASDFAGSELWFVPVVNPDGYDEAFGADPDSTKTLSGVDTDRNWPDHWRYDDEGSSGDPTADDYRGAHAGSEPEVAKLDVLLARLKPRYLLEYQAGQGKILYPYGWQIQTPATDAPALAALAGDAGHPAITGYDPGAAGETAIANGTLIDYAYDRYGTQAFAVQVKDTDDVEADVDAEFAKNLDFALDLAHSAPDPSDPVSHLHNHAPDFVAHEFPLSYGSPQTVEVNARRALGAVTVHWRVQGDATVHSAATSEYAGGSRYGAPGGVYRRLRGSVAGFTAGDHVEVWFEAGGAESAHFTFTAAQAHAGDVLVLAAEDYSGIHPNGSPHTGPAYLSYYTNALDTLGVSYDVYDVDARNRVAPDALGVLSHYSAVVWYTGDDVFVRGPGFPANKGVATLAGDEVLNARDYLNDGGRLLVSGQQALAAAWVELLYNPLGAPGPYCPHNNFQGSGDSPAGQAQNCVPLANDFLQYYLGAYLKVAAAPDADGAAALPYKSDSAFRLDGAASAGNQDSPSLFVTTSSFLDPGQFPTFASSSWISFDRPPAFEPTSGQRYAYAASSDGGYQRLSRVIDLRGGTSGSLNFNLSYDTEQDFDYVFVEAHEVGQNDWTTLPDRNGHTSTSVLDSSCDEGWDTLFPFVDHYQTNADPGADDCTNTGTTGAWNAATGNSGGFQRWDVDLSTWAGKRVEVSITYAQDFATGGLGVYLDDVNTVRDGQTIETQGFESGLGTWQAGPPPAGTANEAAWTSGGRVGFVDTPGVATSHTLLWGFGLEGVTGASARAHLLGDALTYLRRHDDGPGSGDGTGGGRTAPPRAAVAKRHRAPVLVSASRLRTDSKGRLSLRVRCTSTIGCTGALRLTSRRGSDLRVLARRLYKVKPGRTETVRLWLSPTARRSLARARSLRPMLTLANGSGKHARIISKHRITVLAPKR
jgi:hypothetical protein